VEVEEADRLEVDHPEVAEEDPLAQGDPLVEEDPLVEDHLLQDQEEEGPN